MKKYYIHDGKEQKGPFTIEEVKNLNIDSTDKIWYEGLEEWKSIDKLEEFKNSFPPQIKQEESEIKNTPPPPIINEVKKEDVIEEKKQNEIKDDLQTNGKKKKMLILIISVIAAIIIGVVIYFVFIKKDNTDEEIIEEQTEKIKVIVKANNLNVRKTADSNSDVLTVVNKGDELIYMNEQSDFTEIYTILDVKYDASWVFVMTKDSIKGWVYGGAVKFLTEVKSVNITEIKTIKENFENWPASRIGDFFNLSGISNGKYTGYYEYYEDKEGEKILDGKFKAKSVQRISEGYDVVIIYTGTYKEGDANGTFLEDFDGYESSSKCSVVYKNGECRGGKYEGNAEGETYKSKSKNICSFEVLSRIATVVDDLRESDY